MEAEKSTEQSNPNGAVEHGSLLSVAARSVGRAAGMAAKAFGLEHPHAIDAGSASEHAGTHNNHAKRLSSHAQRKQEAEQLKSQAKDLFSKGSTVLGVPYRRVIGKSAANWSEKDIAYVRELIERQNPAQAAS
jgi:hypothetical protein